jgi:hypothetical protein
MKKIFSEKTHTLFFAALIALAVFLFPSNNVAKASSSITLRAAPLSYDLQVNPGQEKSAELYIENMSSDDVGIEVEYSDFFIDDAGRYIFSDDREIENEEFRRYSLKSWLSVSSESFSLGKNASKKIEFKMNVPNEATLGGHYGAIFFRTFCENQKDKNVVATDKSSVCVSGRVGTLLLVSVGGYPDRRGEIENVKLQKFSSSDQADLNVKIKNTGNTHFKPQGKIVIKNIFGQTVEQVNIADKTLLPMTSFDFASKIARRDIVGLYFIEGDIQDGDGRNMVFKKFIFMPPWRQMLVAIFIFFLLLLIAKKFRIQKKKPKDKNLQKKVFEKKENNLTKTDSEK